MEAINVLRTGLWIRTDNRKIISCPILQILPQEEYLKNISIDELNYIESLQEIGRES